MITQLQTKGLTFLPVTDDLWPELASINTVLDHHCFTWAGLLNRQVMTRNVAQWQAEYDKGLGFFALCRQVDQAIVGQAGLGLEQDRVSIGYLITKPYWGRKIAESVVIALLRYGFESLGVEEIWSSTQTDYWASWRILETLGMTYQDEAITSQGRVYYYTLSRERFYQQRRTGKMMKGKKYIQDVLA